MSAPTAARAPAPRYVRKPPPLPLRVGMGLMIYGLGAPMMWGLEKIGRAERSFRRMSARQRKAFEEKNPFRGYVPGKQDVFVATFAKSGTNWMMQIAHQLIWHGAGEFDHIHSVVPWPDTQVMPPWMQKYAIPLEEAQDWESSPERKRVIKTHFDWELLPYSPDARYIIIIRDPKDIFVSSYFFLKGGVLGPAMPSVLRPQRTGAPLQAHSSRRSSTGDTAVLVLDTGFPWALAVFPLVAGVLLERVPAPS